jgi:hypothetical protein
MLDASLVRHRLNPPWLGLAGGRESGGREAGLAPDLEMADAVTVDAVVDVVCYGCLLWKMVKRIEVTDFHEKQLKI